MSKKGDTSKLSGFVMGVAFTFLLFIALAMTGNGGELYTEVGSSITYECIEENFGYFSEEQALESGSIELREVKLNDRKLDVHTRGRTSDVSGLDSIRVAQEKAS